MQRSLYQLGEEERLLPRLHSLHAYNISCRKSELNSNDSESHVTPDMIDTLAKESFPPCMRSINDILRRDHHLRHYGRLHYGLFLKRIGLSLEDALNFFRDEFTKKIAPEKFQREYAYNIRYNYGKEGKKVNLSAFSCQKIINDNPPGPTDTHGCPFKQFDRQNLYSLLKRYGLLEDQIQEVYVLI